MSQFNKSNKSPLFRLSIEKIFDSWTALQICVENGQGGIYGKEIDIWMRGVVEDFFYENQDLIPQEVAEFIEEIMDKELDTAVNDGSLDILAVALCHHFKLAMDDKSDEIIQLHKALDISSAASKTKVQAEKLWFQQNLDDDNNTQTKEDEEVQMETEEFAEENYTETNRINNVSETDDQGWTVVKSNRHSINKKN